MRLCSVAGDDRGTAALDRGGWARGTSAARGDVGVKFAGPRPPGGAGFDSVTAGYPLSQCACSILERSTARKRMLADSDVRAHSHDNDRIRIAGECGANMAKG